MWDRRVWLGDWCFWAEEMLDRLVGIRAGLVEIHLSVMGTRRGLVASRMAQARTDRRGWNSEGVGWNSRLIRWNSFYSKP